MGKKAEVSLEKVTLGSKCTGGLTEDFKHSGSISNPRGTSSDLAVEDQLIGGLDGRDDQGEILLDGDSACQRGAIVTFAFTILGAESHAFPGSLLLLNSQTDRTV